MSRPSLDSAEETGNVTLMSLEGEMRLKIELLTALKLLVTLSSIMLTGLHLGCLVSLDRMSRPGLDSAEETGNVPWCPQKER